MRIVEYADHGMAINYLLAYIQAMEMRLHFVEASRITRAQLLQKPVPIQLLRIDAK